MPYEMTKEQLLAVYNTGNRNFIKLKHEDLKFISEFLPEPGSVEFNELSESEQITVLRVHEIMNIQKETFNG